MSEKRFTYSETIDYNFFDVFEEKKYLGMIQRDSTEIVDRLNEQQATIKKQLDQIIELQDKYRIIEFNHSRLEKRNKAQYEKIGEQQAHINKLQEENASLKQRIRDIKYNNCD